MWAEHARDFAAARHYYASAQEHARTDKAAPTSWDALYADLDKPLDEVDQVLLDHGFTQGGQLKAATPEQFASWLQVDFLLYGHLENFDEFTLGIIGRKQLTGTLKLWSKMKNDYLWTRDTRVSRTSTVSGTKAADLGFGFLQQLVGSRADKAKHQPMSEESAYFVAEALSEIPRRPNP